MEDQNNKSLKELTKAIDRGYGSSWRILWRGFLWGLGRGVGTLLVWGLALTILFQILQATGIWDIIEQNVESLDQIRRSFGR